jgi:hypothetical protein
MFISGYLGVKDRTFVDNKKWNMIQRVPRNQGSVHDILTTMNVNITEKVRSKNWHWKFNVNISANNNDTKIYSSSNNDDTRKITKRFLNSFKDA